MEQEWVKAALVALGLKEGSSVMEIRSAYLMKTSHERFQRIIIGEEQLEKEFSKYYKSYITLLKHFSESEEPADLSYYPQNQIVRIHLNQGIYHIINQNFLRAVEKVQEANQLDKEDELVLIYMGYLLMRRKNYYAAEKYFLEIVKKNKQNDEAWYYLGENYLRAGDSRKAINMLETSLNLNSARKGLSSKIRELKEKAVGKSPEEKKTSFLSRLLGKK